MTEEDARRLALALPGAVELPHFEKASFRVGGRIFATLAAAGRMNVMIDPFEVDGFLSEEPAGCTQLWWGKQLKGVQVTLAEARPEALRALLTSAWTRRAPRSPR